MQNKDKQNNEQEWLYSLKPGDKVIVNYGNQSYYKVKQVKSVKLKKKRDSDNKDIIIGVGSFSDNVNGSIDLFVNGKQKIGKWSHDEILYEYNDYNYQEFIGIPNVARVLNNFEFEGLISREDGKKLLLEIYSRLRKEGWLG